MIEDRIWRKIDQQAEIQRSMPEIESLSAKSQVLFSDFILPTAKLSGIVVDYRLETDVPDFMKYQTIEVMTDFVLLETFVVQINPHGERLINLDVPLSALLGSTVEIDVLLAGGQYSREDETTSLIATDLKVIEKLSAK